MSSEKKNQAANCKVCWSDGVNDSYQTRVVSKFNASDRQSRNDRKCRCTLLSETLRITNPRSAWPTERKTLYLATSDSVLLLNCQQHPEGKPTNGSPQMWNDTMTTVWKGNEHHRTRRGRNGWWDDGKLWVHTRVAKLFETTEEPYNLFLPPSQLFSSLFFKIWIMQDLYF